MDSLCQSLHPIKKREPGDTFGNVHLHLPPLRGSLVLNPKSRLDKEYLSLVADGIINLDIYNLNYCPKPNTPCPICQKTNCVIPNYFNRC
jgi:hypothetical protein